MPTTAAKTTLTIVSIYAASGDTAPRYMYQVCSVFSRCYNKMTMEIILATALGQSLEIQDGKGGEVYENATKALAGIETDQPGLSGNFFAMSRL